MTPLSLAYRLAFQWTTADGNPRNFAPKLGACPFNIPLESTMPVPAGTAQGTEIDISFPGIRTAATFIYICNMSGQELGMAWGGNFMPSLPPNGILCYALPQAPNAGVITSLRFFLTQVQAADGAIAYAVFGS